MQYPQVDRRQFLQGAALGFATYVAAPKLPARAHGLPDFRAVVGELRALGANSLDLQIAGQLTRFPYSARTIFWRGGLGGDPPRVGDRVLVRIEEPLGEAVRVWTNLRRLKAHVASINSEGLLVESHDAAHDESIEVRVDGRTRLEHAGRRRPPRELPRVGSSVDVTGEWAGAGPMTASLLVSDFGENVRAAGPVATGQPGDSQVGTSSSCTYTYTGTATWFQCSNGAGRCGTCSTSRSDQIAWPAMDTCGCCTGSCCDCSENCKYQIHRGCGDSVRLEDLCGGRSKTVYIADCGPCQNGGCNTCSFEVCGNSCSDCKGYSTPIVDLTEPTFAAWYDPAVQSCFSCEASVTVSSPCANAV